MSPILIILFVAYTALYAALWHGKSSDFDHKPRPATKVTQDRG